MTIQELLQNHDFSGKNIVIIGGPASGKTFLGDLLKAVLPDHHLIHTDDYMQNGFEQSLYVMMDYLLGPDYPGGKHLIEGVLGYRLLRKGAELGNYYPDVVIELEIDDDLLAEVYNRERDPEKIKGARSYAKACNTILAKYKAMDIPEDKKPEWIKIYNVHH